tara:strand:+ start:212 stop:1390 length:1179 start_codon:yes stop_codon:yes gene_type:complete
MAEEMITLYRGSPAGTSMDVFNAPIDHTSYQKAGMSWQDVHHEIGRGSSPKFFSDDINIARHYAGSGGTIYEMKVPLSEAQKRFKVTLGAGQSVSGTTTQWAAHDIARLAQQGAITTVQGGGKVNVIPTPPRFQMSRAARTLEWAGERAAAARKAMSAPSQLGVRDGKVKMTYQTPDGRLLSDAFSPSEAKTLWERGLGYRDKHFQVPDSVTKRGSPFFIPEGANPMFGNKISPLTDAMATEILTGQPPSGQKPTLPQPRATPPQVTSPRLASALRGASTLGGAVIGDVVAPHLISGMTEAATMGKGLTPQEVRDRSNLASSWIGQKLRDVTGLEPSDLGISPEQISEYATQVAPYVPGFETKASESKKRSEGVASEISRLEEEPTSLVETL